MSRDHAARRANEPPQKALLRLPGNDKCADCLARGPVWASINLGVFICIQCSGMHRKLGTHISKVRSVTSDEWKPEWVELLRKIGNEVAAHFYEHDPTAQKLRFFHSDSMLTGGDRMQLDVARKLELWIRAKYEFMNFAKPRADPPHVICQRGDDPRRVYELPALPGSGQRSPVSLESSPIIKVAPGSMRNSPRAERDAKPPKSKKEKKSKGARGAPNASAPAVDFDDMFAKMSSGLTMQSNGERQMNTDLEVVSFGLVEPPPMQHPFIQSPPAALGSPSQPVQLPMNTTSSPQLNHSITPTPMGPRGILSTPYDHAVNEIGRPHSDIEYNPATESVNIHVNPYPDDYKPKHHLSTQMPRNLVNTSTPHLERNDTLHVNDIRNGRSPMTAPHFGREHRRDDHERARDDRERGYSSRPVVERQELRMETTASKKEAQWLKQITSPKVKKAEKLIATRQGMIMDSIRTLYTNPGRLGLKPGLYADIRPYGYSVSRGIFSLSMLLDKEGKGPPRQSSPTRNYNGMLALTDEKRPDPVPEPVRLDKQSREILRELDQLTRIQREDASPTNVRRDEFGVRMGSTAIPDPETLWEERQRKRQVAVSEPRVRSPPSVSHLDRHITPGPIYRIERPPDQNSSPPVSSPPRRSSRKSSGQESVVDRVMDAGPSDAISRRHGVDGKGIRSDITRNVPQPITDKQFGERPVNAMYRLASGEFASASSRPSARKPVPVQHSVSPHRVSPGSAVRPAHAPASRERSGSSEEPYSIRQVPLNAAYRVKQPKSVSPPPRSASLQREVASSPQRVVTSSLQRDVASSPQRVVTSSPQREVASSPQRKMPSSPKQKPQTSILNSDRLSTVATQLEQAAIHMSAIETHLKGQSPPVSPIVVAAMEPVTTTSEDVDNMDLSSVLVSLGEATKHMNNLNSSVSYINEKPSELGPSEHLDRLSHRVSVIPAKEMKKKLVNRLSGEEKQTVGDDDHGGESRRGLTVVTQHDGGGNDRDRQNNCSTREREGENNRYQDAGREYRSRRDDGRKYEEKAMDDDRKHEANIGNGGEGYQHSNRDDGRGLQHNSRNDGRRYADAAGHDGREYRDNRNDDSKYVEASRGDRRGYTDSIRDHGRAYRDNRDDGRRCLEAPQENDRMCGEASRDDRRAYQDNVRDDCRAYRDDRDDGRANREKRDFRDDHRGYLNGTDPEYARHYLRRPDERYYVHDDGRRGDFRPRNDDVSRLLDERRAYSPPHRSFLSSSPTVSSTKLSDRYGRLEDVKRDLELSSADMGLLDMAIISQDLARLEAKAARM